MKTLINAAEASPRLQAVSFANPSNRRILIIDDNRAIHEDFKKVLQASEDGNEQLNEMSAFVLGPAREGTQLPSFELDSAFQGEEGCEMLRREAEKGCPYAMAFVDMRMPPGWDGLETIQQMWKIDPDVQIVICTAYSDYSWEDLTKKIGKTDRLVVLKKPFDAIEVQQLANALTEKWHLLQNSKLKVASLEKMVAGRTEELERSNSVLHSEVVQRKSAEQELSDFFENGPVGLHWLGSDGALLKINQAELDMLGYDREEVLGRNFKDFHLEPSSADEAMRRLCKRETLRDYEVALRRKDGTSITALLHANVLWEGTTFVHARCFIRDISEVKKLEEQLRQSQKMEAVGQLSGGVAHDFNNLLTIIQGYAQIGLLHEKLPAKIIEAFEQILAASDRAARLTRQLLAFSRKQVMQRQTINLQKLLTDLVKMLDRILGEDICLKLPSGDEIPAIAADSSMLEQIILNLALNARDAMPKGGVLTFATSAVEVTGINPNCGYEVSPGAYVCLEVADTGCGISPADLKRIFEPFFTTKEIGKGTGLGLATVYGIVRQHQGWIQVESQIGQGTVFRIFFPAERSAATPAAKPLRLPHTVGGSETILLVEDEAGLRMMLNHALTRYGYKVLQAASGLQALKVWESNKDSIDLLLTDMVMPEGMNGLELTERLQADRPNLKVICTSGYSADLLKKDLNLKAGVRFLSKPYDPDTLALIIRESLDTGRGKAQEVAL